ncbi:hypothetical protein [Escherichia coli]|uniref:hypothetical protein n=1 Tax=Escherichia coli TaxID=562 RepID=UPI0012FFEFB1
MMARARSDKHTSCPVFASGFLDFLRRGNGTFRKCDGKSFCGFCERVGPHERQIAARKKIMKCAEKNHEMRTYTISTPFRLCAVCDAQRNGKMICCPVVENAEPHLPICQRSGEKIGTGCVFVGPRTRHQTNTIWSGLRPDTLDTVPATR